MLRRLGAHRKLDEHEKDVSSYMAGGAGDDADGENIVDDTNRQRAPHAPNPEHTAKP